MTIAFPTRGFSDAAQFVEKEYTEERDRRRELQVFAIDSALREEMATVWDECRQPNWDGHDALPVTQDALRNLYLFLESLPSDMPAPSIGAEPDGDLTMEWHRSARRTLSISVSPDGDLHYSALFGANRVHGTETFLGDIPDIILTLIRRVYAA